MGGEIKNVHGFLPHWGNEQFDVLMTYSSWYEPRFHKSVEPRKTVQENMGQMFEKAPIILQYMTHCWQVCCRGMCVCVWVCAWRERGCRERDGGECRERECVCSRERQRERESEISLVQTIRPQRLGKNCPLLYLFSVCLLWFKLVTRASVSLFTSTEP